MSLFKSFSVFDLQDFCGRLPERCPDCDNILRYSLQFDLVTNECVVSVDCPVCERCSEIVCVGSVFQSDIALCSFAYLSNCGT